MPASMCIRILQLMPINAGAGCWQASMPAACPMLIGFPHFIDAHSHFTADAGCWQASMPAGPMLIGFPHFIDAQCGCRMLASMCIRILQLMPINAGAGCWQASMPAAGPMLIGFPHFIDAHSMCIRILQLMPDAGRHQCQLPVQCSLGFRIL